MRELAWRGRDLGPARESLVASAWVLIYPFKFSITSWIEALDVDVVVKGLGFAKMFLRRVCLCQKRGKVNFDAGHIFGRSCGGSIGQGTYL